MYIYVMKMYVIVQSNAMQINFVLHSYWTPA
jgi:hypothetical protein